MTKLSLLFFSLMFFVCSVFAENVVYESEWMSGRDLPDLMDEMNANRLYPCILDGQVILIAIQYKISFCPFPQNMEFFETRWVMSDLAYSEFSNHFESNGFVEHYHSTFYDLSDSLVHQATWVLTTK